MRIAAVVLACVVGLCIAAPVGVAAGGGEVTFVAPTKLRPEEVQALRALEESQMTRAEKAQFDRWAEMVTSCATDGTRLSSEEIALLTAASDPSLEEVVAFGDQDVGTRMALYFPNLFLDMFDVFSGAVGLIGIGLGTEVHITRWAAIGLGVQVAVVNVHWYFNRNLAASVYGLGALAIFGPHQAYYLDFFGAGLCWIEGRPSSGRVTLKKAGRFSMDDQAVQWGYSDPWGVGVGWAAEFHPVELADFFAGMFTLHRVDISNDDFGNPARQNIKSYMQMR